ncbi:MAG TPA: hypothetical protein PLM07_07560 [Candidatus Rifleibacterium sp.]|nr:hypothetical protein [Candidatus Rifleibacterium sp.]HPT45741.1 hypothetical protein [Candidatus Rifleibacterium sp.]
MFNQLVKNRQFNILIIASLMFSIFLVPMPAQAGILGSVLNAVRPFANFAGNIAGAVAGASLGAAFMPPLGILAGGVAGWIVGGIVTRYATGSLGSLATVAGAAVGVAACASFGPIGYVAGALAGGMLGRMAMKLLDKADNNMTGGILFNKGGSSAAPSTTGVALSPEIPASYNGTAQPVANGAVSGASAGQINISASADEIAKADNAYQKAYDNYLSATREGNAEKINTANKAYQEAFNNYRKLTGKDPQK